MDGKRIAIMDVERALDVCRKGAGRIYYIDRGDDEVYEWDTDVPLRELDEADEIFAVMTEGAA